MGPAWYNSEAIKGIVHSVLEDKGIDAILLSIMFASANKSAVRNISRSSPGKKNEEADPVLLFCSRGNLERGSETP